jgi:drug/metabolite transporter (DMT)-like permease
VSYVLVLGLEALVAFGLALFAFGETVSPARLLGIALIVVGAVLLN